MTRSSANREVSACKKKRDSVKYLRRWISVAATAALPTPRILTKYSRSFIRFRRNISLSLSLFLARFSPMVRKSSPRISNQTIAVSTRPWIRGECFEATTKATSRGNRRFDPNEKLFSSGYSFILPDFARACDQYVLLHTRCHSNFLTISLPLSSKFRTRTSISPPTIFAPYSLTSRMRVPTPLPNFYYQKKLPVRTIEK